MPRVTIWFDNCQPTKNGHVTYVRSYGPATSVVRTVQSAMFFVCLTYQTERDIFSIRSPFDKVNIPPESGRWDGCNGTDSVAFWALSFLSIFQALSGFWIQFQISHPPLLNLLWVWTNKSLWDSSHSSLISNSTSRYKTTPIHICLRPFHHS